MFSSIWIISVAILLVSFILIFVLAGLFTEPVDEYKFSFQRIFPFEAARRSKKMGKYYSFSVYLFAGMCFSPLFLLAETTPKLSELNLFTTLLICFLGLSGMCFVFLNIFDVSHVKAHIMIFTLFVMFTILSCLILIARGFIAYYLFLLHGADQIGFLITSGIGDLIFIVSLFFIFNPKLKHWARLDFINNKHVRPKKFILAYYEWVFLVILLLVELLLFVQLLFK